MMLSWMLSDMGENSYTAILTICVNKECVLETNRYLSLVPEPIPF